MNHLGLFEGIGGFSLAAKWMGWETVAWCEKDPFCQKVLNHHFPNAIGHSDIKETDFKPYANTIDILTGGFPCQPYSLAGKRKGKDDDRHLWPEMLRAIREVRPPFIVGENVFGLINWGGGMVFEEVQADLEAEGYEVQSFVLPAAGVNAPHRRDRLWIVAYSHSIQSKRNRGLDGMGGTQRESESDQKKRQWLWNASGNICEEKLAANSKPTPPYSYSRGGLQNNRFGKSKQSNEDAQKRDLDANSNNARFKQFHTSQKPSESRLYSWTTAEDWTHFPSQSPVCGGNDGIPPRLDNITFSRWRRESIKCFGNAIVPQVAFEIFKALGKTWGPVL